MPRPNVLPHDPRPSLGTLTPQYRQPTPWHAWVGPNRHATGASLHTQRRRATKPTTVATLAFIPSPYTSPAGVLARQRSGSAQGLGGTPGVEKMGEPAAESLLPPAPDPLHRQVSL